MCVMFGCMSFSPPSLSLPLLYLTRVCSFPDGSQCMKIHAVGYVLIIIQLVLAGLACACTPLIVIAIVIAIVAIGVIAINANSEEQEMNSTIAAILRAAPESVSGTIERVASRRASLSADLPMAEMATTTTTRGDGGNIGGVAIPTAVPQAAGEVRSNDAHVV